MSQNEGACGLKQNGLGLETFAAYWKRGQLEHPAPYGPRVERFIAWARIAGQEPGAAGLRAYLEERSKGGASASTICGYYYAVKVALRGWTEYETSDRPRAESELAGWALDRELAKIRLPRVMAGKRAKMILEFRAEQLDRVIRRATPRIGSQIEFLADTGVRVSEMCNLAIHHVRPFDPEKSYITIMGKGDKERTVWISEALLARIRRIYKGKTWLFETASGRRLDPDNVYKEIRRTFWRVAQIRLTPHNLRHYLATRLLRAGASTRAVGEHLGHSDPATTGRSYDVSVVTVAQLKTNHHGNRGRGARKERV